MGEREKANDTVNVRTRDNRVHGEFSVATVIERFRSFADSRVLNAEEKFIEMGRSPFEKERPAKQKTDQTDPPAAASGPAPAAKASGEQ